MFGQASVGVKTDVASLVAAVRAFTGANTASFSLTRRREVAFRRAI
jgi:hypothetical protein